MSPSLFAVPLSTEDRTTAVLQAAVGVYHSQRYAPSDSVVSQPMFGSMFARATLRLRETKTAGSRRTIALDTATTAVVSSHRTRQLTERLKAGSAWRNDHDLVFCREDGTLLPPNWVTRIFQRTARAQGLEPIGPHGLRHSWATLALQAGVPAKVVSERLGHSNVGMTLDRYSHVLPTMQEDAAETVGRVLFG